MKPIKNLILERALNLFNKNGFVNVRLQHIADSSEMSIGNLAYHFKNKEEIVLSLYNRLRIEQESILATCRVLPLFGDIDYLLSKLFELQTNYSFFYLDTLEVVRAYEEIAEKHSKLLLLRQHQILYMVDFNSSRGAFITPQFENQFYKVAHSFCLTLDNWMSYQIIEGNDPRNASKYHEDLWAILRGLFTLMGIVEYGQLEKSYNNLNAN